MCFSTEASFIAGATLTTVGVIAMKKAEPRSYLAFAAIPFLFAIQQFSEGVEWLAFHGHIDEKWLAPFMYVFLLFAQVIWPAWVPFATYKAETEPQRRKVLKAFVFGGAGLAVYHVYCLLNYNVSAEVSEHHILYRLEYLAYGRVITNLVYFSTAVIPPFLTSNKRMQVVGLANLISLLATYFLYREYLLSVWCYFAAMISVTVLWAIYPRTKETQESQQLQH